MNNIEYEKVKLLIDVGLMYIDKNNELHFTDKGLELIIKYSLGLIRELILLVDKSIKQ